MENQDDKADLIKSLVTCYGEKVAASVERQWDEAVRQGTEDDLDIGMMLRIAQKECGDKIGPIPDLPHYSCPLRAYTIT